MMHNVTRETTRLFDWRTAQEKTDIHNKIRYRFGNALLTNEQGIFARAIKGWQKILNHIAGLIFCEIYIIIDFNKVVFFKKDSM